MHVLQIDSQCVGSIHAKNVGVFLEELHQSYFLSLEIKVKKKTILLGLIPQRYVLDLFD